MLTKYINAIGEEREADLTDEQISKLLNTPGFKVLYCTEIYE
jgi:hypothetical protein